MDPDLTLEKAKQVVCQQESIQGQQAILNKPEGELLGQAFSSWKPAKKSRNTRNQRPQATTPRPQPGRNTRIVEKGHIQNRLPRQTSDLSQMQQEGSLQFSMPQQITCYICRRSARKQYLLRYYS